MRVCSNGYDYGLPNRRWEFDSPYPHQFKGRNMPLWCKGAYQIVTLYGTRSIRVGGTNTL